MSNYNKQMRNLAREYKKDKKVSFIESHKVAEWAIRKGKWKRQESLIIQKFVKDLGIALREERHEDPQGRKVRTNHVVLKEISGKQIPIWSDLKTASHKHMQLSLLQRRKRLIGNCSQLKTDMDSYNENYNTKTDIQLSFNFTNDIIELEIEKGTYKPKAKQRIKPTVKLPHSVPVNPSQATG